MTTSTGNETLLQAIREIKAETDEAIAAAERRMIATVSSARDDGLTWEQIGAALGVTRQGAMQKYGAKIGEPR